MLYSESGVTNHNSATKLPLKAHPSFHISLYHRSSTSKNIKIHMTFTKLKAS